MRVLLMPRASPAEGAGANASTFSQTMENDILCQTLSVGQNDMYSRSTPSMNSPHSCEQCYGVVGVLVDHVGYHK